MPNALSLPIGPGLTFRETGGVITHKITDHNRSEIKIGPERIENRKRMANATLRTFVVATKRKFSVSWEMLPRDDQFTVDGFWGAKSIKEWYDSHTGDFDLILTYGNNTTEIVHVMFSDFSIVLKKRNKYNDYYDIDMSLEEI